MIKTTLKIDGMMCGMCEAHMNDVIRKNFKVKKVTSSAKSGETVIISEDNIDTEAAKKAIKDMRCFPQPVSHMRKRAYSILESSKNFAIKINCL